MGLISKPHSFSAGATIIASEHNSNFDLIYGLVNGSFSKRNSAITYSLILESCTILFS